ncbi:MAG TPA: ATP-binding protein, partial [Chitinophagaceae bacterium]|nr:ATP-binding protein [Chitinophagaceae bacterium]
VCKEDLDRASVSLSQIAQQVQQLSHSLNNNWVAQHGLISSIAQELERLRANATIDFEYTDHTETALTLSTDKQIILFRVFQEILNNALKHAKASRIMVSLENRNGFQLGISDNGKGFDVAQQMSRSKGMGLGNIVNRAQIIGFDCTISSQNNTGTSFLLKEIISL